MSLMHDEIPLSPRFSKNSPRGIGVKASSPSLLSTGVSLRSSKSTPRLPQSSPHSPDCLPQSLTSVYPDWLESRKDFLEVKHRFERLDAIDCFQVCQKPILLRSDLERKAVAKAVKSCPFFSSMKDTQLMDVTECLHSVMFLKGETLMAKSEPADCLYMILSGRVGIYIDLTHCVDEVIRGNVVGESAIQTRTLRSATVVAHENVKALKLTYEDYDQVLYRIKLQDYFDVASFLRQVEFFVDWNLSKLYRLASVMMVKQYAKGQKIFRRGEEPHDIYMVRNGTVRLTIELDLVKSNRWPISPRKWTIATTTKIFDKTLKVCKSGDFFGAEELIDEIPLRTTAVCESDMVLLFIIREEFFHEIFSDKDRKSLSTSTYRRPQTQSLRYRLDAEKNRIKFNTAAMLDAIRTNAVPSGRDLFQSSDLKKKVQCARRLEGKRKKDQRKDLIRQVCSREEEES